MKHVACLLVALALVACTPGSRGPDDVTKPSITTPTSADPSFDGWTVDMSIRPTRLGPLQLSIGPVAETPTNDADPWLKHDVVYRNMGTDSLRFDDTRTSLFLRLQGEPRLIAADEGCGYGINSPGDPVVAGACQDYLDAMSLKPGRAKSREVTLFKELKGMGDLIEGTYVFRKEIRFQVGQDGKRLEETLAIRYTVRR